MSPRVLSLIRTPSSFLPLKYLTFASFDETLAARRMVFLGVAAGAHRPMPPPLASRCLSEGLFPLARRTPHTGTRGKQAGMVP